MSRSMEIQDAVRAARFRARKPRVASSRVCRVESSQVRVARIYAPRRLPHSSSPLETILSRISDLDKPLKPAYVVTISSSSNSSRSYSRSRTGSPVVWWSRVPTRSTAPPSISTRRNARIIFTSRWWGTAVLSTGLTAAPAASATFIAARCTKRGVGSQCTNRWPPRRSRTRSNSTSIIIRTRSSSSSSNNRRLNSSNRPKRRRLSRPRRCPTERDEPVWAKVTWDSATRPTRSRAPGWPATPPAAFTCIIITIIIRSTTAPSPRPRTRSWRTRSSHRRSFYCSSISSR